MSQQARLPNLLVPGVGKSGTSSLFWYLSQHPDICPADKKEVNYFKTLRFGPEPAAPIEQYASHFSHCAGERYRLDASQLYFDGGPRVRAAVKDHFPKPKVLPILRDPVDRLFSSYLSSKHLTTLPRSTSFGTFFDECRRLRSNDEDLLKENARYRALRTSYYIDHVCAWFEEFDDVHIVFFEHMVEDPRGLMVEVCDWLGLDPRPVDRIDFTQRNKTVSHRSRRFYRFANAVNLRLDRGLRMGPRMKRALRRMYWTVNATEQAEQMTAADRARVEEFFAPSNAALREELRQRGYQRLPRWLDGA